MNQPVGSVQSTPGVPRPRKVRLSFNAALWLIAGLLAVWLFGWPLVMNAWAAGHWRQIPCHVDSEGRYGFAFDGKHYHSGRRDFWSTAGTEEVSADIAATDDNATCWVNPNDPKDAVMHLDAPTHWGGASGRIAGMVILVAALALMTFFGTGKRRIKSVAGA